jgi:hypothetical protein
MSRADRWTEDDLRAVLARGQVRKAATMPPEQPPGAARTLGGEKRISSGQEKPRTLPGASRRQKQHTLTALVLMAEWQEQLATLAPLTVACGGCAQRTQHQCTLYGWRCEWCGVERMHEELRCGVEPVRLNLCSSPP